MGLTVLGWEGLVSGQVPFPLDVSNYVPMVFAYMEKEMAPEVTTAYLLHRVCGWTHLLYI